MIRVAWFVIRSNERVILPKTNGTASANYNGLSIAGFSLSCAAIISNILLFGLPGIVGLILSIVGLCQCNKRSEKGRGLAIAGIVIGAVLTLLMILTYAGLILAFDNAFDNAWNSGPRYY